MTTTTASITIPSTLTQSEAERLASELQMLRQEAAMLRRRDTALTEALRRYIEQHDGEALHDGETGVTARLQRREGAAAYDTMRMSDALALFCRDNGVLTIDRTMAKALRSKCAEGEALHQLLMPGAEQWALVFDVASAKEGAALAAAKPEEG